MEEARRLQRRNEEIANRLSAFDEDLTYHGETVTPAQYDRLEAERDDNTSLIEDFTCSAAEQRAREGRWPQARPRTALMNSAS